MVQVCIIVPKLSIVKSSESGDLDSQTRLGIEDWAFHPARVSVINNTQGLQYYRQSGWMAIISTIILP